ncbi:hypothetical protein CTRI78_v010585 [Colletotrichum trifolii]|uniref:DUF7587 domain-containing protein n=1 Tax=Colletotrichum trifolii TaxID=5466 RepID=A0A4V3HTQ6_COLTR|nr:hypothetical protein CTRI78_v010585 [Colletotrichum trifolii]
MAGDRTFYRVQSDQSFTHYDEEVGFAPQGNYYMNYEHWVTKDRIEAQLNWKARPLEPSPFISVFDNLDAKRRAAMLKDVQHTGVFVAEIRVSSPETESLDVGYANDKTLPVLTTMDETGVCTSAFFSTHDARRHLAVDHRVSQLSEWFTLGSIPHNMIVSKTFV